MPSAVQRVKVNEPMSKIAEMKPPRESLAPTLVTSAHAWQSVKVTEPPLAMPAKPPASEPAAETEPVVAQPSKRTPGPEMNPASRPM